MNAQTVGWLVFLATIKNISCLKPNPFSLDDSHLTATEGSCIEIKCRVTPIVDARDAYWFWIKNAQWDETDWNGTVIYSTNTEERPVSAGFSDRVNYTGSPSSSWNELDQETKNQPKTCSILICDLNKTDNGNYSFRFCGKDKWKWITQPPVRLEVKENLCPITFEKPPDVNENDTISLTCSTLTSCPSNPQIGDLTQWSQITTRQQNNGNLKSTRVTFPVNWRDDGKVFSCQTNATDRYMIRTINLTVEYAPKDTSAEISPKNVVENQSVTLTCSAKGRPEPNITWFKNRSSWKSLGTEAVMKLTSIKESQNGEYYCEAKNKRGTNKSNTVNITVTYRPEVEVTSPDFIVSQGNKMTLTCNVKRSNPKPHTYAWFKDGKAVPRTQSQMVVWKIEPEHSGFYKCNAINTVGTGTSKPVKIEVEYGPRKTTISINESDKRVGVGNSLTFYCNTEANPAPFNYSWYRYNNKRQMDSSQWTSKTTQDNELRLNAVKRADEACYMCNATNLINTGEDSKPVCIEVLYAPTEILLSMASEVREGQLITIRCTVESFPPSTLTLTQTSDSNPQSSKSLFTHSEDDWPPNALQHSFNATSTHTGSYTCHAGNSKGSNTSEERKLVVKYSPKDVAVKAQPDLVVNENKSLTLDCSARSYPPVTSVTWMKITDGKTEILQKTRTFILKSVSPSDGGLYICEASNDVGTGKSQQTEVKVNYAPKHTKITTVAEDQFPDGTTSVTLSCSSQSYPPVKQYSWYKMKAEEKDEKVSDLQRHMVNSDQPGVYYCVAENEMYRRVSDPVHLFERNIMKTLFIFLFFIILLVIFLIVVVYRHKRKKSCQQGTASTLPCFGFLGWWNGVGRRRRRMNNPGTAEPFRSRDDLLSNQPHRPPNAQRYQPRPDSTPASNINSVYCTVNLPSGQQRPPPPKIISQQGGHTQEDSLNYASLHFGNKPKNKGAEGEEDVYAKVSKQKPPEKTDERLADYENANAARAPMNSDTDTSEDEVQLNYSQVSFKAKPGHQQVYRDSSDEDETQYSEVKI